MTVVDHLRHLVAFNTTNPPRKIFPDQGIFAYARDVLDGAGFQVEITDLGEGCLYLYAFRGNPSILFNVHLDTVPADENYSFDPWSLRVEEDRAIGLGACDIKGAAAGLLAAAQATSGPAALLFSSDEEAGSSICVKHFCAHLPRSFDAVIVAEPTNARAVTGHRGIKTFTGRFSGISGHSSGPHALEESALHRACAWVHAAVEQARLDREEMTYENLAGSCFNVGVVEGGKKPNIVASQARVRWGVRPLPGQDADALADHYFQLANPDHVEWLAGFTGPSLPAHVGDTGLKMVEAARAVAEHYQLPSGEPVNFWTEAALFSQAGLPAIVFGPGDIAQAHTADEWVSLRDLDTVTAVYTRIFS